MGGEGAHTQHMIAVIVVVARGGGGDDVELCFPDGRGSYIYCRRSLKTLYQSGDSE